MNDPTSPPGDTRSRAPRREIFAWAMFDFANSGYTTVVLTTIYNAYFVGVVAAELDNGTRSSGLATLLWTVTIAVSNFLVLTTAPILGSIADHTARKKALLTATTGLCVVFTAALALTGPGNVALAMCLLILSNLMFGSGENLIAAFLPEIAPRQDMGRISGYGWSVGYLGGLLVLLLCLGYVSWAQSQGHREEQFVPVTMLIVAGCFALAALPTLLWLRERATATTLPAGATHLRAGFERLRETIANAHRLTDLFRFMLALTVYSCGINTVVVLAAVYARAVMGLTTVETIFMIIIVNVTAAIGAFLFGHVQDRMGSVSTLAATLLVWVLAILIAYLTTSRVQFWIAANLIGLALGSCQSAGRALIGQFTPRGRSAEYFGLWGLSIKLSSIIGPVSYGVIGYLTQGNHRAAIVSTLVFFLAGLALLLTVDEKRGRAAAAHTY